MERRKYYFILIFISKRNEYLFGLVLGGDEGAIRPGGEDEEGVFFDLAKKMGFEAGISEKIERNDPHISMHFSN